MRIKICHFDLDTPDVSLDHAFDCLDADERDRAKSLTQLLNEKRFTVAHFRQREIIAAALRLATADVTFSNIAQGKPVLAHHTGLHFNLSHSEDRGVLALAPTALAPP
jgi:phosphopantetheinyl transferase